MTRGRGVTLIEILIVLAVVAVLAVGVARSILPGGARRAAVAYQAAAVALRLGAMTGTPAGLRYEPEHDGFVVRSDVVEAGWEEGWCGGEVRRVLPRPQGVAVTRYLRDGIVWLPDGTGRSCSGGGVYGGRLRFEDRHEAWDVVVSSSGRIRLEPGP